MVQLSAMTMSKKDECDEMYNAITLKRWEQHVDKKKHTIVQSLRLSAYIFCQIMYASFCMICK